MVIECYRKLESGSGPVSRSQENRKVRRKLKNTKAKIMAEHKFTVDLSGLELSEAETAHLSGVIHRAAMSEIAALSAARGKGANLDLQTKFDPRIYGGRIIARLQQL